MCSLFQYLHGGSYRNPDIHSFLRLCVFSLSCLKCNIHRYWSWRLKLLALGLQSQHSSSNKAGSTKGYLYEPSFTVLQLCVFHLFVNIRMVSPLPNKPKQIFCCKPLSYALWSRPSKMEKLFYGWTFFYDFLRERDDEWRTLLRAWSL